MSKKNVLAYKIIFPITLPEMNKQTLTPLQAWDDFLEYARQTGLQLGNDVSQAKRDRRGGRKTRRGTVVQLGAERIERLLNKYAPGRYTFQHHTTVTVNEKS